MHADSEFWILCEPPKVSCIVRASLHFSPRLKLRMEETVCGSYDSKSVPVAKRIYPFSSTGAIVTETRVPLKSCRLFLFFVRSSPLRPRFLFSRGAPKQSGCGVSFSHSMRLRSSRCEENPFASRDGTGVLPGLPRKIQWENPLPIFARDIEATMQRWAGSAIAFVPDSIRSPLKYRRAKWIRRCDANRKSKEIYQLHQVSVHRDRQHNHMSVDDLH